MSSRKRKHGASPTPPGDLDDRLLHIQAYEADIRCGPTSARSLEASSLHIGEALIKHSTGDTEVWLDRCVGSIPSLRNPVCSMCSGTVADIRLTFTCGLSRVLSFPSSCYLGRTPAYHSPSDTMHVSSWIRRPCTKGQENGGRHPHPDGPISLRIRRTLSSSVRQKPKTTVEISAAAS